MIAHTLQRALGVGATGAALLGLLTLGNGCGSVGYTATATVDTPRMVALDSGVWVVAEYDDPVFYVDDAYWRYQNGVWYRSSYLGGWSRVRVSAVPPRVRRIDRPRRYRHYRPSGSARVRAVPSRRARVRTPERRTVRRPGHHGRRVDRRDARQARREARRERRQDRREARRERRHERREARRDRRHDRREARHDRRSRRRGRGRGPR